MEAKGDVVSTEFKMFQSPSRGIISYSIEFSSFGIYFLSLKESLFLPVLQTVSIVDSIHAGFMEGMHHLTRFPGLPPNLDRRFHRGH